MKTIILIASAVLIAGVLSAQSHNHNSMQERGSYMQSSGIDMMNMGSGCCMGGGMHGMMFD